MPSPRVVRPWDLADALCAWLRDALTSGSGGRVLLAVGETTLPLYRALPLGDKTWGAKRILPLDETIPPSFFARLHAALPEPLRGRLDEFSPHTEALLEREGACAAVLGLGPDGHVAFNQRGSDPTSETRVVELTAANRARIGDVASRAWTVGIATLMRVERLAIVAAGPGKSAALRRLLDGPEDTDVPATLLRAHPDLTVLDGT